MGRDNKLNLSALLIALVATFLIVILPVNVEAAQIPGVVDGFDLDLGGVYYAYPDYVSQYPGTQQEATKRVKAIYVTNYDKYYGYNDYLYKTIEYDDKGNLIAIYEVNGSADKVTWTETFEYDAEGRMIRRNSISSSGELIGWTVYDRDEQGRLIKMSSYTKTTGDNPGSYFCYYYEDGKAVKTDGWAYMGGDVSGEYIYDDNGNMIKERRRGIVVSEYEYDELGRLVKHITNTPAGEFLQDTEFLYYEDGYLKGTLSNDVLEEFVYEPIPNAEKKSDTKPVLKCSISNDTVICKWNKVKDATGYKLYRREKGSKKWTKIKSTKKTKFTDKTVVNGKTYEYFVKVYKKKDGKTAWTTKSTVVTLRN